MKIDRDKTIQLVKKHCGGNHLICDFRHDEDCELFCLLNILEQNPDLITDLPQNTEQIPLPVKTTWTLKPEFRDFVNTMKFFDAFPDQSEIGKDFEKFYEHKTDPDYSKVPVGAVIEISTRADSYFGIVKENDRNKITIGYTLCTDVIDRSKNNLFFYYSNIKSLTILKLPEGK